MLIQLNHGSLFLPIQTRIKQFTLLNHICWIKRFQYNAIDDSTRIWALKIYPRQTQENAIDFISYVVDKFPFRIKVILTDNGHEFQAKFNWHVCNLGMDHVYIKPGTPRINGKVERSHLTYRQEF